MERGMSVSPVMVETAEGPQVADFEVDEASALVTGTSELEATAALVEEAEPDEDVVTVEVVLLRRMYVLLLLFW